MNDLINISIPNAGVIALLGYLVVFLGLVMLMVVVMVMGRIMVARARKAQAAAAVEAAPESYRNDPSKNFDYKENVFFQEDVGDALTIYHDYYQKLKVGE